MQAGNVTVSEGEKREGNVSEAGTTKQKNKGKGASVTRKPIPELTRGGARACLTIPVTYLVEASS